MTFADVDRTFRYWNIHPPVRDLVAAFMGVKPKAASEKPQASHPSIAMLKARYPDGVMRG